MRKKPYRKDLFAMTPEQLEAWLNIKSHKIPNKRKAYNRADKSWKKEL
jgi:hypothetical protein